MIETSMRTWRELFEHLAPDAQAALEEGGEKELCSVHERALCLSKLLRHELTLTMCQREREARHNLLTQVKEIVSSIEAKID